MALERRKGWAYSYTAERVGRRGVKRYWGGGPGAAAMAHLDALTREQRKLAAEERTDRLAR